MSMTSAQIRETFLSFFESKGHRRFRSYPLVPPGDATLLFTNAGMVQFKDVFTGNQTAQVATATSSQKCLRVSGKHNDLEEVGVTPRHHTFFEMLGNFSFGDYFKKDAIIWAWQLLTEHYKLDPARLYATVFEGDNEVSKDEEAYNIWHNDVGLSDEHIIYMGAKDNFWAMGETGACGPCSELLYDQGPDVVACDNPQCDPSCECGRYLEVWNLVFMQFDRDQAGLYHPLPKPSIDTGMGLERMTALLQGQTSNYHTDLFLPLIAAIEKRADKAYERSESDDDVSMRVIADHARATAFLISEGVLPSNEGRGYVLRRIMRRAIRHGHRLGIETLFLHKIALTIAKLMSDIYPELASNSSLIDKVTQNEEASFRNTLDTGMKLLQQSLRELQQQQCTQIPGDVAFKLYDTYGFPLDLTEVIAAETNMTVDIEGFDRAMQAQKERAAATSSNVIADTKVYKDVLERIQEQSFVGYPHEHAKLEMRQGSWQKIKHEDEELLGLETSVVALIVDGKEQQSYAGQADFELIVAPNPYYGEAGGQVGDNGYIIHDGYVFEILDTIRPLEGLNVARGRIKQGKSAIQVKDKVLACYPIEQRLRTRSHHSATHLLHKALQEVLGDHVKQAGSLVAPDRLRFDYTHFSPLDKTQLAAIETQVAKRTQTAHPVETEVLGFEEAKQKGAMMLFGEKYGDTVRVVSMADSMEFCGGTHAQSTTEIDPMIIIRDEALASGIRRIEALSGKSATKRIKQSKAWFFKVLLPLIQGKTITDDIVEDGITKNIRASLEKLYKGLSQTEQQTLFNEAQQTLVKLELAATIDALPPLERWHWFKQLFDAVHVALQAKFSQVDELVAQFTDSLQAEARTFFMAIMNQLKRVQGMQQKAQAEEQHNIDAVAQELVASAKQEGDIYVIYGQVDNVPAKQLRQLADIIRSQLSPCALCLVRVDEKLNLLVALSHDLEARLHAGNIIKQLAPLIGGRGGGKAALAQAGGSDSSKLQELQEQFYAMVIK